MTRPPWRDELFDMMVKFVQDTVQTEYDIAELGRAYPFHALFFRDDAIIAFKRQRSIVTRLGRLYPKVARIIASSYYHEVHIDYALSGTVDSGMLGAVEKIITELRSAKRRPDHQKELEEISRARNGEMIDAPRVIADLYIGDFRPFASNANPHGRLFVEIKSPLPNLDICAESKKKMLIFRALYPGNSWAFLAFPYNPFLTREDYDHTLTGRVMDIEHEILMGAEFWEFLGGTGTYSQLLDLIEQVKRQTPFSG